ncbi:MAG: metal ABC transporter ATP-binding protein [Candidatus Kerfeldbacteria bacterium]|nr:metal ABC transporter ATP-binding protein [Candidatus Kerfeldbacteria bacterium]
MSIAHNENLIEIHNVSYAYATELVLKDVSFVVHRGDYLGIVGPNGGGKTTMLKIILGLLTPTSGEVRVFGTPSNRFKHRSALGYVPQNVAGIERHFPATVEEVVAMGRYAQVGMFHRLKKNDYAIIERSLEQVGMANYRQRLIGDLSGGQLQRVFIARALAAEPEVLILDEPTVGVDVHHQEQFYALLRKLNTTLDLTLILVSHDLDIVAKETTELACINQTITYHGSPAEFVESGLVEKVYGPTVQRVAHHHV